MHTTKNRTGNKGMVVEMEVGSEHDPGRFDKLIASPKSGKTRRSREACCARLGMVSAFETRGATSGVASLNLGSAASAFHP